MRRRVRQSLLGIALVGTLGAAVLAPSKEGNVPAPGASPPMPRADVLRGPRVPDSAAPAAPAKMLELPRVSRYQPRVDEGPVADLFEPRRPPAPVAPPPPAPVAPKVPFTFMGTLETEHGRKAYLARGSEIIEARIGETFAGEYRLEEIDAEGAEVTYLPLDTRQRVSADGAKP